MFNLISSNKLRSVKIGQRRLVSEASLADLLRGWTGRRTQTRGHRDRYGVPSCPYESRYAPEASPEVSQ